MTSGKRIVIIGPNFFLKDRDRVWSCLAKKLEKEKADCVIFVNSNLIGSLAKEISSEIKIGYYLDYLNWDKMWNAYYWCWEITRNWFKDPKVESILNREFPLGVSPAYLNELDTFQKIVRPVRHIVHLQSLFKQTTECKSYVIISSSPSFLRLTELVMTHYFPSRKVSIEKILLTPEEDSLPKHVNLKGLLPKLFRVFEALLLDVRSYFKHRYTKKAKQLYPVVFEYHRITMSLISQRRKMISQKIYPVFLLYAFDISAKRFLFRHDIPFINVQSFLENFRMLFPWAFSKRDLILPRNYNLYYDGVPLFQHPELELLEDIKQKIGVWKYRKERYSRLIKKYKIKCCVTCSHVSDMQKLIFAVTKEHMIPSISLQHGMLNKIKTACDRIYSDYYMAWGHKEVEDFEEVYPGNKGKIEVIGSMVYDEIDVTKRNLPKKEIICKELSIPISNNIVLYAPPDDSGMIWSPFTHYDLFERQAVSVIKVLSTFKDVTLIINLHPMHTSRLFQEYVEQSTNIVLLKDYNIFSLISVSDCVLFSGSTVGMDAMHWQVPIIQLALHGSWLPLIFVEYNAALSASSETDLHTKLHQALYDPDTKQKLIEGQKKMIRDYMGPVDGMAHKRFVEFLNQLVTNRNECY